jgi:hypothetical protein
MRTTKPMPGLREGDKKLLLKWLLLHKVIEWGKGNA